MMNAFTNWKWYQSRAECNDWSDRPGAMYCNWDGVTCNSAGQVVEVKFLKNGSYLTGTSFAHSHETLFLEPVPRLTTSCRYERQITKSRMQSLGRPCRNRSLDMSRPCMLVPLLACESTNRHVEWLVQMALIGCAGSIGDMLYGGR